MTDKLYELLYGDGSKPVDVGILDIENPLSVTDIIEILIKAERIGSKEDEPEGTRYIQISDTLTKRIIGSLVEHLEDLESDSIDAMGEDA